ncbi:Major Facilitator Superfamily [Teratosphaeria destructans]|uniref:Major Facilitator Superfamily n=1 Tax=Teratosphaeria destructans TaxID=418781 RepID=A0A9W7SVX0_9PEZI|nr:Major Facilitator Superfamily [Teratosphaeria destructans]
MAHAMHYARVNGEGDTQSSSSQELHSARYTPEMDSDEGDNLEKLEAGEGYELQEYGRHSQRGNLGKLRLLDVKDDHEYEDGEDAGNETAGLAGRSHRSRSASVQSFQLYTPDQERAVRRKLDIHLVLFVALLYLMSFLDRSNIGNAKIAGLTDDLSLSDDQYEWLLTIFYMTYVLFEWMTLCYKIFPPHIYISCCVCAWGVLASLQAITISWAGLLVLRGLLGIGEAAFVGMPFYLSFFFKKDELAFRIGLFISAAPLATSFASSLAWAIVSLGDRFGIASWRLLFLLEGFPACLVAVWAWSWLPDEPATACWLTPRERKVASLRMRKEASSDDFADENSSDIDMPRHKAKFNWAEVLRTLRDPKAYLMAAMFFCCNVAFSSMPVFLPAILSSMGFSRLGSQGMAAPPFLFAFGTVLLTTFISDRAKSRSIPMVIHGMLAASGYVVLASAESLQSGHTVRYLAVFPICAGFFSAVAIVITWMVNNQPSDEAKGTGMAMLNVIGQMGPLVGTRLYPDSEGPYYVKGMAICAGAMVFVAILAFALRKVLEKENSMRKGRDSLPYLYIT